MKKTNIKLAVIVTIGLYMLSAFFILAGYGGIILAGAGLVTKILDWTLYFIACSASVGCLFFGGWLLDSTIAFAKDVRKCIRRRKRIARVASAKPLFN